MSLFFNMLTRYMGAFLPRRKCLLISWVQSPSTVILEPKKIKSVTLSTSCPSICHKVMSTSVGPFSFCLQSFSASGSFPVSWLFASGGQSIGASASASVLPMNVQGWFPLGLTGLTSLQSKGLSRVFSSITVRKPPLDTSSSFVNFRIVPLLALPPSHFEGRYFLDVNTLCRENTN